jgi:hypothetical protein
MLRVQDDGRGIDFAAVRLEAFRRSFISFEDLNTMDESRSAELIFLPGVTTRRSVSEVSGRGMGMNAVLHAVRAAGGSIGVRSRLGQGTVLTIRLPLGSVTLPPGPTLSILRKKRRPTDGGDAVFSFARRALCLARTRAARHVARILRGGVSFQPQARIRRDEPLHAALPAGGHGGLRQARGLFPAAADRKK